MKKFNYSIIILMFLITIIGQNSLKIGPVSSGDVAAKAIEIFQDTQIDIYGIVLNGNNSNYNFDGWILETNSRELIWHSNKAKNKKRLAKDIFEIRDNIKLPKGTYEIYYSGLRGNSFNSFSDFWQEIFSSGNRNFFKKNRDKFNIELKTNNKNLRIIEIEDAINKAISNSFISLIKTEDLESLKQDFTIKKDTKIKIYSIGEGHNRNELFDYAWIINNDSHKKIWDYTSSKLENAGGAKKNILKNEVIHLTKGNYTIKYVTDDSHSFEKWNEMPPLDPFMYGVTLFFVQPIDKENIVLTNLKNEQMIFVDITKVRDEQFLSKGFKLKKEISVLVEAYGEEGFDNELVDYGWIINADTRETIWKMERNKTEHAGGAMKNRVAEVRLSLKPGNYIVYFQTDDSHSYNNWNENRPYEPTKWGITLSALNKSDLNFIENINSDEYKPKNILLELTKIKGDANIYEVIELEKDTKLRIVAIGEGSKYEMSDFAWIDNATNGKNVWEMTYRKTDHAGGASKNRKIDEVIILPRGKYKVYYQSDDSHHFANWNETPPRDQEMYGITIFIEK